jgi:flavin-dependent dehydrogenase
VKIYDAVVAGGGVAGATAALALASCGRTVLLIESTDQRAAKIGETLAPETKPLLEKLGLWDDFTKAGHLPCPGHRSAWGSEELHENDFIFNPHGNAWQLDRAGFEDFLRLKAEKKGARVLRNRSANTLIRQRTSWRIEINGEKYESNWVIDATGRSSRLARQVGIIREVVDHLVSIHTRSSIRDRPDADARTIVESHREGWWYSALVPDGKRVIAFQTDADCKLPKRCSSLDWFLERLEETRHLRELVAASGYQFTAKTHVVSAHSSKLEQTSGEGWLAVGDAAASFDPLSGQGLFNALLSGTKAAEVIFSGGGAAVKDYDLWWQHLWNHYLDERHRFYRAENRWSNSKFWAARHGEKIHDRGRRDRL